MLKCVQLCWTLLSYRFAIFTLIVFPLYRLFFGPLDLFQRYGHHIGRFDDDPGVCARFQEDLTAGEDASGSCATGNTQLKFSRNDLRNCRKGSEYPLELHWSRFALVQSRPGSKSPWFWVAKTAETQQKLQKQNSWNRIFFIIYSLSLFLRLYIILTLLNLKSFFIIFFSNR